MVQRQSADVHRLLGSGQAGHGRSVPCFRLQHIGNHIAMQQNRALGHAGRAAGVLENRDVIGLDVGPAQCAARALRQGIVKTYGAWQVEWRHHFLDGAHHVVDKRAFDQSKLVAHSAQHDMFDRRVGQALLKCAGKIFDNHNRLGT